MSHPLVQQLRFTRKKWLLGFQDVSSADALKRFEPMNSLSWMLGHLAFHEQLFWCIWAQGETLVADLANYGWGKPASTPDFEAMWSAWRLVTQKADIFLDSLTNEDILQPLDRQGNLTSEPIGTLLHRNIYHYWFHIGESQAVRQLLGHTNLSNFVGNIAGGEYQPEHL